MGVFLCHGYAERLTPYYSQIAREGGDRGLLCFGHSHVLLTTLTHLSTQFPHVSTPYLHLHGREDKICSPEGSKDFHKLSTSDDKTLDIVESGPHNLYLEREDIRNKAISDTVEWIKKRE